MGAITAAWLVVVAVGMGMLIRYQLAAGEPAVTTARWPQSSALQYHDDTHTLVMIAHPHCSCTRASIAELSRLMTRLQGQVQTYVVFVQPEGIDDEQWVHTDLWSSAAIITGVSVIADPGGKEADRFGARTSGQTYLYSPDGTLLFSGGITPARSHQGNSVGRERIISLVTEGTADRESSDVFGCSVFGDERTQR